MRSRRSHNSAFSLFSFQDIITSVMGIVILILLVMALELAQRQLDVPAVQHAVTRDQAAEALAEAQKRVAALESAIAAGNWSDLAAMSAGELRRERQNMERLIPQLESDLAAAQSRLGGLRQKLQAHEQSFQQRHEDRELLDKLTQELNQRREEGSMLANSNTMLFRPGPTIGQQPWLIQISGTTILAAPLGPQSSPLTFAGSSINSRERQLLSWCAQQDPTDVYFVLMVQPGGAKTAKNVEKSLRGDGFKVGLDLLGKAATAIDPMEGAPYVTSGGEQQ